MTNRKEITKEWLQSLGFTNVTKDGKVFYKNKECKFYDAVSKHKHGKDKKYPVIMIYDPKLFQEQRRTNYKYKTGQLSILLSRVVYAWFNEVCPSEYDVDHIDNNPYNNDISNLQLLTRKENLARRMQRNQHTCHLTDEELKYFNEQKFNYKQMIQQERNKIEDLKEEIKKLESDLNYYTQVCKNIDDYKLYKEVKEDYVNRIAEKKDILKRYKEDWHSWCNKFKEFKTTYLTRETSKNE